MTISGKDIRKLAKASALSHSNDPKDQDRARARKTDVDYKDLIRQLKAKRKKMKEENELDEKFATQYKDKSKLGQSSQRKSLGRGASIKDGAKKSGYESKKEHRDTSKKLAKYQTKGTYNAHLEDWKPEIEHSKLGDAVKKKREKKRKEAESSLPPHLRLDVMKKAFAHTNESFTIDKSAHKSAQKKAKMRNLAKGNTNPNEKAAAEKKAGGPKLYGEEDNYGQAKKELKATKKARDERHKAIHSGTNTAKNTDVNEGRTFADWKKAAAKVLKKKDQERKPQKAQDAGAKARRMLKRREHAKYVSGSEDNVPDEMRD